MPISHVSKTEAHKVQENLQKNQTANKGEPGFDLGDITLESTQASRTPHASAPPRDTSHSKRANKNNQNDPNAPSPSHSPAQNIVLSLLSCRN